MVEPKATYQREHQRYSTDVARLEGRARSLGTARLVTAALAVGLVGALVWAHPGSWAWAGLAAAIAVFVALIVVHARVERDKDLAAAAARFYQRGLARLRLDWDALPATSVRFRSPEHPFVGDLDIFGRASLMQIVDATETSSGEQRLAAFLALDGPDRWPDGVAERQAASRDLAPRLDFRERLATAAGVLTGEKSNPSALLAWAEDSQAPPPFALAGLVLVGWLFPCVALAVLVLSTLDRMRPGPATAVAAALIVVGLLTSARFTPMIESVSAGESGATRWRAMIATIENQSFDAPLLQAVRQRLFAEGQVSGVETGKANEAKRRKASDEMAALERIVGFVDARRNEVFRFVIGPLLMWDVHCALALFRWRTRTGAAMRVWFDALADMEALSSLAAFTSEHPEAAWPVLEPQPVFEAQGLGHPLIAPESRVGNAVSLPSSGHALVVTGSNMSGKSTLLRAMGINAVLAFAGAPVCASTMRIGPLRVATSMRIEDSLSGGVSHFYAELARLKQVIDKASVDSGGRSAVFFLLDEILHGTNSRERIVGACAVVRQLLAKGALGAVSTHDLGITELERVLVGSPYRVQNVHFEEQVVAATMTFDYRLRSGVVQSSNALRLMRAIGIDVDEAG